MAVYGAETMLGLTKQIRRAAGIKPGDAVEGVLEPGPLAKKTFDALGFTHRREYARWIAQAKREETITRRVTPAIEMLHEATKTPG